MKGSNSLAEKLDKLVDGRRLPAFFVLSVASIFIPGECSLCPVKNRGEGSIIN